MTDYMIPQNFTVTSEHRPPIEVATLSGNSLRQTVHTHRASVHQAPKLAAALLRVAGVTAEHIRFYFLVFVFHTF